MSAHKRGCKGKVNLTVEPLITEPIKETPTIQEPVKVVTQVPPTKKSKSPASK